jgi:tryptophan 2,3-dioxygenase
MNDESDVEYGSYLRLDQLLTSQTPLTEEHDELQFIIVHQVFELWFRLILHEISAVKKRLGEDDAIGATRSIRRITDIVRIFPQYVSVLETMHPQDFHAFRGALGGASGLQSEQFRLVEMACGLAEEPSYVEFLRNGGHWTEGMEGKVGEETLRTAVERYLERQGITVREAYDRPGDHLGVATLLEACTDLDEAFLTWRFAHVRLAERMIGSGPLGTGGMGAPYLKGTLRYRFFPALWKVREEMMES